MNYLEKTSSDIPEALFPVVGIGASAGGLDAYKKFILAIPEKSGMAYVLVQHMSPTQESMLTTIISKVTHLPVEEIKETVTLEKDHIYVMPAGKLLTVVDGTLVTEDINEDNKRIKPIDLFFTSLATVHQNFAVGVVLSGNATDGTLGLKVIKEYGGVTFGQNEASAAYAGMPKSAANAGVVDFIMAPEEIPGKLIEINQPFLVMGNPEDAGENSEKQNESIYKQILSLIRLSHHVDFNHYKQTTVKRRMIRRMALNKINLPAEYLDFVRGSKTELEALYNDMLISVTSFFRDAKSFDVISKQVFPLLLNLKKDHAPLRIWVAGCATGQEAYSMTICLHQAFSIKHPDVKWQIFATDLSEKAIAKARNGIYTKEELESVSPFHLQEYFTKIDGSYQVNKSIRETCIFARHNFLKDPPFAKVDFISCRNVLIYMEPVLQKKAYKVFHYALNAKGFLMLGKSETVGSSADLFTQFITGEKTYIRNGDKGKSMSVASERTEENFKSQNKTSIPKPGVQTDYQKIADQIILAKHAPAGVVIDEQMEIVQFRGPIINYLEPAQDKASLNLLKMVAGSLSFELRNILHKAKKTNQAEKKEGLHVRILDQEATLDIEAIPLPNTDEPHYLILFHQTNSVKALPQKQGNTLKRKNEKNMYIKQLENELAQLREDMRSITEEQEAANEELQSANEELLSGSEELQTVNEEMETSQEELQSTNEEMQVINNELIDRNDQLVTARNYMEAIINTIRDTLIILDKNLVVKSATLGFYQKFKLIEQETEGKLLYELGNNQWDIPDLKHLLEEIIPNKTSFSNFELTYTFPYIGERNLLLNARRIEKVNDEQYILLAIEDVTEIKAVEKGLEEVKALFKESQERLKLAVGAAGIGIWDYYPLTNNWIMDDPCKQLYTLSANTPHITYEQFITLVHPDDRGFTDDAIQKALNIRSHDEFEIQFRTTVITDGRPRWIHSKGKTFCNAEGKINRFVGTSLDITKQKLIQDDLEQLVDERTQSLTKAVEELKRSNNNLDEFASIASHDLQEPLRKIRYFTKRIQDADPDTDISLERIITAADRMKFLIEGLLEFSRLSQDTKSFVVTDLNKILEDVLGDFEVLINEKNAVIQISELPTLKVIPMQIDQLFKNLLGNALKFTKTDLRPQINVSARVMNTEEIERYASLNRNKLYYFITVSDNGIGFNQEYNERIFELFQRLVGKSQYEGTGIGLAVCKKVVMNHDGLIFAESTEDVGTSMHVILPG